MFTDAVSMARMAQTVKREDGDVLCRLPFSVVVDAEQFGATLSLTPKTRLPAVRDFPHAKLDEIAELPPFDFARGQMAAFVFIATLVPQITIPPGCAHLGDGTLFRRTGSKLTKQRTDF